MGRRLLPVLCVPLAIVAAACAAGRNLAASGRSPGRQGPPSRPQRAGGRRRRSTRERDGTLGTDPVVDKRVAAAGPMQGSALARAESEDGVWVHTLYQGDDHAFVHALDTSGAAHCIDFPHGLGSPEAAEARRLRLGPSRPYPDGSRLTAENDELGVTVAVDPARLAIVEITGTGGEPYLETFAS